MYDNSFNRIKIDCTALQKNYTSIQKRAGHKIPVMAMVKADGYGHGMVMAARAFQQAGCANFGVAELREGVLLREAGVTGKIYVTIGFAGEEAGLLFQYHLTPVIYDYDSASAVSQKAVTLGRDIGIHIKVDTGMSRLGVLPSDFPTFLHAVSELQGISIQGVMSHFPESDNREAESNIKNFQTFMSACLEAKSSLDVCCHIANSGAVLNFPHTCCNMARAGIALYGYHPAGMTGGLSLKGELTPAMSFRSQILQVKTLPAGVGVSYGYSFTTTQETRIAVLPVGYEDGYSRLLSNKGQALIHGHRVPICGRVCMNMCMVDVSEIENVQKGDEVVLLGRQGEEQISADEIAEAMGSISYEVLCLLGNNNKRQYIE